VLVDEGQKGEQVAIQTLLNYFLMDPPTRCFLKTTGQAHLLRTEKDHEGLQSRMVEQTEIYHLLKYLLGDLLGCFLQKKEAGHLLGT
jgi:hypothetical protein